MKDFLDSITPDIDFIENQVPKQPDYEQIKNWAALPSLLNEATISPEKKIRINKRANCFYIHPTGFFLRKWNSKVFLKSAAKERTNLMLATQASAFNQSCDIFAPLYRQATYAAIASNQSTNSIKAFEVAYSDIKESFRYFVNCLNDSKPIILAAHSQGSFHSQRLLQEPEFRDFFSEKLISAYLIGYPLEESFFDYVDLEPCEAPSQIRSIVHFGTVGEGSARTTIGNGRPRLKYWKYKNNRYLLEELDSLSSINPISWNQKNIWVQAKKKSFIIPKISGKNVLLHFNEEKQVGTIVNSISFVENQDFSVRLREDGLLEAKGPTIDRILKKDILGFGDLHVWEYQLFWNYLRENASHRTNVYFEKYES